MFFPLWKRHRYNIILHSVHRQIWSALSLPTAFDRNRQTAWHKILHPVTRPQNPGHLIYSCWIWSRHIYHFLDMISFLFYSLPLSTVSLQHAFFSARHQNSPPQTPPPSHKFAHLDYTVLQNIPPETVKIGKSMTVQFHSTRPGRRYLVPDKWLFNSQWHCLSLTSSYFCPFDISTTSCVSDTGKTTKWC